MTTQQTLCEIEVIEPELDTPYKSFNVGQKVTVYTRFLVFALLLFVTTCTFLTLLVISTSSSIVLVAFGGAEAIILLLLCGVDTISFTNNEYLIVRSYYAFMLFHRNSYVMELKHVKDIFTKPLCFGITCIQILSQDGSADPPNKRSLNHPTAKTIAYYTHLDQKFFFIGESIIKWLMLFKQNKESFNTNIDLSENISVSEFNKIR